MRFRTCFKNVRASFSAALWARLLAPPVLPSLSARETGTVSIGKCAKVVAWAIAARKWAPLPSPSYERSSPVASSKRTASTGNYWKDDTSFEHTTERAKEISRHTNMRLKRILYLVHMLHRKATCIVFSCARGFGENFLKCHVTSRPA